MNEKDRKLMEIFEKLPKVKDGRSEAEIYRNVQNKMNKKQRKPVFIPVFAIAATLLFFIVAVPLLFQQSQANLSMDKSSRENNIASTAKENAKISILKEEKKDSNAENQEKLTDSSDSPTAEDKSTDSSDLNTAVYEHEKNNGIVTFGAVTSDAIAIPISLQTEWDEKKDWLANYKEAAQKFEPEVYGFNEFAPLIDAMNYNQEEKTVYITISPENKEFFIQNQNQLRYMVEYSLMSQDVEQAKFVNEQNEPAELGDFGEVQPITIDILKKSHYSYPVNGREYIVPADLASDSLAEAVTNMKFSPNYLYKSLILDGIEPIVKEEDGEAVISFNEKLYLDEGDSTGKIRMIEGILFTAKEFGFDQVQFENIEPATWEQFDFSNPVPVPTFINLLKNE